MIRQVAGVIWRAKLEAMTPEDRAVFLAEFQSQKTTYQTWSNTYSAQYKNGEITWEELQTLCNVKLANFTTWALANQYYEDVTDEQVASERRTDLIEASKQDTIDGIKIIITAITNHFRVKQGKTELTQAEVVARLMA